MILKWALCTFFNVSSQRGIVEKESRFGGVVNGQASVMVV